MVECFIFDLDGVIVNTSKYHFLAWKKIADQLNIHITEIENEQLKGISREDSLKTILKLGNRKISEKDFKSLLNLKNKIYLKMIDNIDKSALLPLVSEKLEYLKALNRKIVLASSSKNAKAVLEKTGLVKSFDAIVDGNEILKPKPEPEIFLIAAKKVNILPKYCVVFEDAVAGIEAAKKAEMLAIGIGENDILHQANFVFKNFSEISNEFLRNI